MEAKIARIGGGVRGETAVERSRRLYDEARAAAAEVVGEWLAATRTCVHLAEAVAADQAAPPGVRSVAEQQARELAAQLNTVEAVTGR